ncbi:hypothetical protein TWF481_004572 [Arthrobotrys musiformis]|uniref:Uncharacterized protein n=1 Tax=Arthrobotrys musiformis TaxID=47236 RepID=A0AAV9WK44_9PEZI
MSRNNYGQPTWSTPTRRNPETASLLSSGSAPPSYSSVWDPPPPVVTNASRTGPLPKECCRCAFFAFLQVAWITSAVVIITAFIALPSVILAWNGATGESPVPAPVIPSPSHSHSPSPSPTNSLRPVVPPPPPPPPPEPFQKVGLSGEDVPLPGLVYIITEANSSMALTYNGNEGVVMAEYNKQLRTQKWNCHEAEGWLAFTVDPGYTTLFLGYSPWPSPAHLRCSARTLQYSEMFQVSKLENHGFRMKMKDGSSLKPVGRDSSGALAMVGTSDVWWRFTKA